MVRKIILALVIAVAVGLLCSFLGAILLTTNSALLAAVGAFLKSYSELLGLLAGLWFYFSNRVAV